MSKKRKKKPQQRADKNAQQDGAQPLPPAQVQRDAQGRTHLLVHRDAQGRTLGLTLSQPLFHERWQNDVATAAANTAHHLLADGLTLDRAVALGRNAMAGTSKLAEGALRLDPNRSLACHEGCAHCCYQEVGVSAPEVFAIYEHLRATRSASDFEATVQRIREADDKTRGMSSAERLSPLLPCPFLQQERCSIYEVRPLACRGKNSLDATACERSLREPEARAQFLAGSFAVPSFVQPLQAFHAVAAGLQLALNDLYSLQVLPLELTAAMRVMMDEPAAVPLQWLRREDPFKPARGADRSDNAEIRELSGRRSGA